MDSNRRKCFGEQLPPVQGNSIVPSLVRECVINIEKQCNLEGLFEADESQPYSDEVKEFIKQLDRVKKGSISTILPNAHISSGVLKHYLSNLSKPLTPAELLLQEKGIESDKEVEQYLAFQRAIKNLPKENQLLLGYLLSFYFRLQRKQATHTAEKFGKVFGPAFVGIRATEKQKEFSRKLYTNIIKSIDLHFPIGTTVASPTAPTISLKEDSEVPVGYIAVRVNNYQVTSLIKGVQVKSVRALYKFEARKDSEISMDPGDIIEVTYQDDQPGWWEGRLRGKTGIFPANYCEVYEILKKKMRILKIDTKKVSDKILLMQNALNFGKEQPKDEKDEHEVQEEKKEEKKENAGASQIQENFTNFQEISSLENVKLFSVLNENKSGISIPFEKIEETFQFYHKILFETQNKLNHDISAGESNETLVFYIEDEEPATKKQTTQNNNQKQPQKVEETKKTEIKEEKKIEIQEKPKENEKQAAREEEKKAAAENKEKESKKIEGEKSSAPAAATGAAAVVDAEKKEKERKTKDKNNKKVKEDKKEKKTKEKSKTGSRKSSTLPKPEKKSKSSKSKSEKKKKGENKAEKPEENSKEQPAAVADVAEQKAEAAKPAPAAPAAVENNKADKELKSEPADNKEQEKQQHVDKTPSADAVKPSQDKPAEKPAAAQPVAVPEKAPEPVPVKEKEAPAATQPAAVQEKPAEPEPVKEKEVPAPAASVAEKKAPEVKEEKKVEPSKAEVQSKDADTKGEQKKPVVKNAPKATTEATTPGDKKPAPKAATIPKNVSTPSIKQSTAPAPLVINQANLSAFEKDRELFEKLQAIQQQIEQERIRRSQIEVDLQSVTGQLVSVISKFENRRHAKDRLVHSIQKQRTKAVKT